MPLYDKRALCALALDGIPVLCTVSLACIHSTPFLVYRSSVLDNSSCTPCHRRVFTALTLSIEGVVRRRLYFAQNCGDVLLYSIFATSPRQIHKNVVSVLQALRFVIYDHCKQLITLHIRSITVKHLAPLQRGEATVPLNMLSHSAARSQRFYFYSLVRPQTLL